jgi:hypothetical protein
MGAVMSLTGMMLPVALSVKREYKQVLIALFKFHDTDFRCRQTAVQSALVGTASTGPK